MSDHDYDNPRDDQDWSQEETYKSLSSYADLFSAICIVFLFLYIVSSFQSSLMQIAHEQERKRMDQLKKEELETVVNNYKKIVAAFETERNDYLNNKMNPEEAAFYHDTLSKLTKLAQEKEAILKTHEQQYLDSKQKAEVASSFAHQLKQIIDANIALKERVGDAQNQRDFLINNQKALEQKIAHRYQALYEDKLIEVEERIREEQSKEKSDQMKEVQRKIASIQKATEEVAAKKYEYEMKHLLEATGKMHLARYNSLLMDFKDQVHDNRHLKRKLRENSVLTTKIISSVEDAMKKEGIPASVDKETGEITLHFDQFYFEKNSSKLTPQMATIISKALPIYAKNVFGSTEMANKIDHFEIIGYASPTFNKKYIDPKTPAPENFQAINYNLDLSYRRARSIFQAIFHPKDGPQFEHKERMMGMTRVSGRSSLEARAPSSEQEKSLSAEEYCQKYKCNEQQRVVIKFNLKD